MDQGPSKKAAPKAAKKSAPREKAAPASRPQTKSAAPPPSATASQKVGGKEQVIQGTARQQRVAQGTKRPSVTLSIRFLMDEWFTPATADIVIVPTGKRGLPESLLTREPFAGRELQRQFAEQSNKFEAPAVWLPPYAFENLDLNDDPAWLQGVLSRVAKPGTVITVHDLRAFQRMQPIFLLERLMALFSLGAEQRISIGYRLLLPTDTPTDWLDQMAGLIRKNVTKDNLAFDDITFAPFPAQGAAPVPTPEPGPDGHTPASPPPAETKQTQSHFLDDRATENDLLGYYPYAAGIAAFVKFTRTRLPLTIAIDGAWGTGKSSLMKMLRKEIDPDFPPEGDAEPQQGPVRALFASLRQLVQLPLERASRWLADLYIKSALKNAGPVKAPENRKYISVMVNAWRHGKGTQLKASLVNEVLQALAHRLGPDFLLRLELRRFNRAGLMSNLVRGMLTNGFSMALLALASGLILLGIWYKIDVPMLPKTWREFGTAQKGVATAALAGLNFLLYAWKNKPDIKLDAYLQAPDYLKLAGDDAQVEQDFRRILKALEEMGYHLALFVDDLDRCSPAECAAVVEALNTFFGAERNECLFVLGMHREMVAESLEVAYEKLVKKIEPNRLLKEQQPFGRRFLEKIVQFFVTLPEPGEDATREFLDVLTSDTRQGNLEEIKRLERALKREEATEMEGEQAGEEELSTSRKILRGARKFMVNLPGGTTADFILETSDKIIAELEQKGVDIKAAKADAKELSALKERIEERKNADENQHVLVFKQVRILLRSNPRQYKRFFNKLRFFQVIGAGQRTRLLEDAVMAALALEKPEEFYRLIKEFGGIRALCTTPEAGAPGEAAAAYRKDLETLTGMADLFEALERDLRGDALEGTAPDQQQAAE